MQCPPSFVILRHRIRTLLVAPDRTVLPQVIKRHIWAIAVDTVAIAIGMPVPAMDLQSLGNGSVSRFLQFELQAVAFTESTFQVLVRAKATHPPTYYYSDARTQRFHFLHHMGGQNDAAISLPSADTGDYTPHKATRYRVNTSTGLVKE